MKVVTAECHFYLLRHSSHHKHLKALKHFQCLEYIEIFGIQYLNTWKHYNYLLRLCSSALQFSSWVWNFSKIIYVRQDQFHHENEELTIMIINMYCYNNPPWVIANPSKADGTKGDDMLASCSAACNSLSHRRPGTHYGLSRPRHRQDYTDTNFTYMQMTLL